MSHAPVHIEQRVDGTAARSWSSHSTQKGDSRNAVFSLDLAGELDGDTDWQRVRAAKYPACWPVTWRPMGSAAAARARVRAPRGQAGRESATVERCAAERPGDVSRHAPGSAGFSEERRERRKIVGVGPTSGRIQETGARRSPGGWLIQDTTGICLPVPGLVRVPGFPNQFWCSSW
jgi:hypothetical protein